jgi:hypothetical protein
MKNLLKFSFLLICLFTVTGAFAQSGARVMFGAVSADQSFIDTQGYYSGYEVGITGRLGARAWYFSPSIIYQNTNVLSTDKRNPFSEGPKLHTLKVPVALGLKFKAAPNHQIFGKAGVIGNYILVIDENPVYNFRQINETYASVFFNVGYDLYRFTIDYRYEQSITNNFSSITDSKATFHVIGIGLNF